MNFLDDAQQQQLIQRLIVLTESKKISWESTASPHTFRTNTGRFGYTITSRDDDDFAPFDLRIYDLSKSEATRAVVETVSTDLLEDERASLEELYRLARGQVLGLDNLADELFRELNEQ